MKEQPDGSQGQDVRGVHDEDGVVGVERFVQRAHGLVAETLLGHHVQVARVQRQRAFSDGESVSQTTALVVGDTPHSPRVTSVSLTSTSFVRVCVCCVFFFTRVCNSMRADTAGANQRCAGSALREGGA